MDDPTTRETELLIKTLRHRIKSLRHALEAVQNSYSDAGCDGCGTIGHDEYRLVEAALELDEIRGMGEPG